MFKVLVTGATGFIGRLLVDSLLTQGVKVRVLTREPARLHGDRGWSAVEVRQGDLTNVSSLGGVAKGCDCVFHLAGEIKDATLHDLVNRVGTHNLLREAIWSNAERFVFLSSVGVFGARGETEVLDETAPTHPRNSYEISKLAAERAALMEHAASQIQVTSVRPAVVYGEGRNPQSDSFFSWARAIKMKRFVQLGRDFVSSYVYVGDVVAACLAIANDLRTGGEIYTVNEPIQLSTLVSELATCLDVPEPAMLPQPLSAIAERALRTTGRFGSLYNRTVYSMDKLGSIGFTLPFGYREGLRQTVRWYRENRLL